jgi:natural product biosynthesis luciferase-like monooxygenase protein
MAPEDQDALKKRLAGLSPEQREILLRRLKQKSAGEAAPSPPPGTLPALPEPPPSDRPVTFSLFFFSESGSKTPAEGYELLIETARFGDAHGFAAVWTPERHFGEFGGFYPNPAVLGAHLAARTERIGIRAGSVVLPLHHPLRVAEEWAVVDNVSRGRVGVSFASGWHPTDFALRPEGYRDRKDVMFAGIETVRRLWRGEAVRQAGVDGREVEVRVLPRPVQAEIPVWVTASTSPFTWTHAGEIGANVLTIIQPLPTLADRIARYRAGRAAAGLDPEGGTVTVMVHAYVADDEAAARETVRRPMMDYLRNYLDQYSFLAGGDSSEVRKEDVDTVLGMAFEGYYSSLSLLGHPDKCARTVDHLRALGTDEIACLVDFGVEARKILDALPALAGLQERYTAP